MNISKKRRDNMQQIIINRDNDQPKSRTLQTVQCGRFFESFLDSQKKGYQKPNGAIKDNGLNDREAVNLRDETVDILNHCNPHNALTNSETTHLVVGYVQSGKTMSFTGLTALAKDNGYRVVVYLAGTKKNLLNQTCDRLEDDLITNISDTEDYFKIHKDPTVNELEDIVCHLELSTKPIILIPILKHYEHINQLAEIFNHIDFKDAISGETVLIIDDEADQASLNSFGRKNSNNDGMDEDKVSRTYESIIKLRSILPGNTYIQYTATPQANILISMQDLLSPKSHTLLTPGEGYIGGKLFFGRGENNELFGGRLIKNIPPDEVFHKKKQPLKKMPKSLKDALMIHIMAVAIIVKFYGKEKYLSMMVHVDSTKQWNRTFKEWIDKELRSWRKALKQPEGHIDRQDVIDNFKRLYPNATELYDEEEKPSFEQIYPFFADIINDKKVSLVNSDKDAEVEINWKKNCMHILVGGEMLNRGFTVEKLATTYMPRYSLNTTNADTIQQRCRFFGYKRNYIKSCKVFLPSQSVEHYFDYISHEEELRSHLATCDSLEAAERKILLSDKLRPTRLNILPVSVVRTKLSGIKAMSAFDSASVIAQNNNLVNDFLKENAYRLEERKYGHESLSNSHRGFKLSIDEAILFLNDFHFANPNDAMRKAATIRYLRYLSSNEMENPLKYVYFIQMAYGMKDDEARGRDLNFETKKLDKELFQSSTSNYAGDRKMVEEDSITIQLYQIHFKNLLPIDYPKEAYTLAINYPEHLATSYCAHEEYNPDEENDD